MTIPLDNLYDYIFSLTGHNNKNLAMYRFDPHGSKSIKNLICHNNVENVFHTLPSTGRKKESWHFKLLFCHDQEPLNFSLYKNNFSDMKTLFLETNGEPNDFSIPIGQKIISAQNIAGGPKVLNSVYDKKLLLHSELKSQDLKKYEKNNFLGIYYWSHAFIALDWYRFAKHDKSLNLSNDLIFDKDFNIYCRAWDGSREYRLTFLSLLKENSIDEVSNISFNKSCNNVYYSEYRPKNKDWDFQKNNIDNLNNITFRNIDSSASATYDPDDYKNSAIDVVLETVFDKKKIQLTEKILRPIACGKPFILASEKDSLEYLKSYGFKTFGNLIDESYDCIEDPTKRLDSIVKTMKSILVLSQQEKNDLFLKMHKIAEYNKNWFFSEDFFKLIDSELRNNLNSAFNELKNPKYQTAKEMKIAYRTYRRYKSLFSGESKKYVDTIIHEYPERIELSKKNIGKY